MFSTKRTAALIVLALAGLLLGGALFASSSAQAQQGLPDVLAIPPGETAIIHLRGYCLDPGKLFPSGITNPGYVAQDPVRAGLYYATKKGYTTSNPFGVQAALWNLQYGTWQGYHDAVAQEIVDAGHDPANMPPDPKGATLLMDAINAKTVSAKITFTPASDIAPDQAFYGDGDLEIVNISSQDVNVFLPFGSIFPATSDAEQRLVGYETNAVQASTRTVIPTDTRTPTPIPDTPTALPTNTPQPTATKTFTPLPLDTPTPTFTAKPTNTPAPTATNTPVPNCDFNADGFKGCINVNGGINYTASIHNSGKVPLQLAGKVTLYDCKGQAIDARDIPATDVGPGASVPVTGSLGGANPSANCVYSAAVQVWSTDGKCSISSTVYPLTFCTVPTNTPQPTLVVDLATPVPTPMGILPETGTEDGLTGLTFYIGALVSALFAFALGLVVVQRVGNKS